MSYIDIHMMDGDLLCYWARGHLREDDFLDAVAAETGDPDFDVDEVKHDWFRNVPCQTGEYDYWIFQATPEARGAYRVTLVGDTPCHHSVADVAVH